MSAESLPNLFSASIANIYKDILEDMDEEVSAKNLNLKIQELERKIKDQAQQQTDQEFEFHNQLDRKKVRWVLKFLGMKLELENYKKFYQDGKRLWLEDLKNLCRVIQTLFKKLKQKDDHYIDVLKDIDREVARLFNGQHSQEAKFKESKFNPLPVRTSDTEEHDDMDERASSQNKDESMLDMQPIPESLTKPRKIHDTIVLNFSSSGISIPIQENAKDILLRSITPLNSHRSREDTDPKTHEKLHYGSTFRLNLKKAGSESLNASSLSLLIKGVTDKLRNYLTEANHMIATEEIDFDEYITKTLKRVRCIVRDKDIDIFGNFLLKPDPKDLPPKSENMRAQLENDKRSFVSVQSIPRSNYSVSFKGSEIGENDKKIQLNLSNPTDRTINNSVLAVLNRNLSPSSKENLKCSFKNSDEKSANSQKLLNKIFKLNQATTNKATQKNVQRLFENVQESLSISEREAIVYTLIEGLGTPGLKPEDQKDLILIEEIVALNTSTPENSHLPEKLKQNSINKFLLEGGQNSSLDFKNTKLSGLKFEASHSKIMASNTFSDSKANSDLDKANDYILPHFKESVVEKSPSESVALSLSDAQGSKFLLNSRLNQEKAVLPATIKQEFQNTQSFKLEQSGIVEKTEIKNPFSDNKSFELFKNVVTQENISPIVQKVETVAKKINFDTFSPIQYTNFELAMRQASAEVQQQRDEMKKTESSINFSLDSTEKEQIISELSSSKTEQQYLSAQKLSRRFAEQMENIDYFNQGLRNQNL